MKRCAENLDDNMQQLAKRCKIDSEIFPQGFNPTPAEWEKAESYFRDHPNAIKFDKWGGDRNTYKIFRDKLTHFSFIKINGIIYAMSNNTCFQTIEGGIGLVKQAKTKDGTIFALKIEDVNVDTNSDAYKAGVLTGLYKGHAVRQEPRMIFTHSKYSQSSGYSGKKEVKAKFYTVMEWGGEELFDLLQKELTRTQNLLISLRACHILQVAHQMGVIHGDFKSENITAKIHGNYVSLRLIDLDSAIILGSGQNSKKKEIVIGTDGFYAPEIIYHAMYSSASDIYALGVMLLFDIGLGDKRAKIFDEYKEKLETFGCYLSPWAFYKSKGFAMDPELEKILSGMLDIDPEKRPPISKLMMYLCNKLEISEDLESDVKDEIRALKNALWEEEKIPKPLRSKIT